MKIKNKTILNLFGLIFFSSAIFAQELEPIKEKLRCHALVLTADNSMSGKAYLLDEAIKKLTNVTFNEVYTATYFKDGRMSTDKEILNELISQKFDCDKVKGNAVRVSLDSDGKTINLSKVKHSCFGYDPFTKIKKIHVFNDQINHDEELVALTESLYQAVKKCSRLE